MKLYPRRLMKKASKCRRATQRLMLIQRTTCLIRCTHILIAYVKVRRSAWLVSVCSYILNCLRAFHEGLP